MKNQYNYGFISKPFILLFLLSCFFTVNAQEHNTAQKKILEHTAFFENAQSDRPMSKLSTIPASERNLIEDGIDVNKAIFLSLDSRISSNLVDKKSDKMVMILPYEGTKSLELHLIKSKVFTEEFNVYKASDRTTPFPYKKGVHYWGIVKDDPNSMVAISFYKDEIVGTLKLYGKSYDLGRIGKSSKNHILYENKDIKKQFDFECSPIELDEHSHDTNEKKTTNSKAAVGSNCVRMYLETDYSMYEYYGSVESVSNYVTGAFNQVILLYANESIDMSINELVVWDIEDPYPGRNTGDALTEFRNGLGGNYNGDLAHLIARSTEFSGGRAYVNVLCNSTYGVGVSGVNSSYNNVPTYSWTVMVLAHEIGHNLGSSHTHSCSWNGDGTVIDDCGNVYYVTNNRDDNGDGIVDNLADAQAFSPCFDNIGNIIPAEGGTIMSYCHLNNVGIDLSLGFGQQPGDLIRNRVANASCLSVCNSGPLAIEVASTDINCGGSDDGTATVSASGGTGSYTYSWSNGATGASIANLAAGSYTVMVDDGNETLQDTVTISDNNNTYYADSDSDGYGDSETSILACSQPANYVLDNSDCNDGNDTVYPGAIEICDGLDNNCIGGVDEGLPFNTYYADADGDGYGDPNVTISACDAPIGYVSDNTDCSDDNSNINPGMTELCDGIDNNCDGSIDENVATSNYYADTDGDGYGDPNNTLEDCSVPQGYVVDNTDCNDSDASVYPTAACDDGDSCTINDAYNATCDCVGTLTADADGDGVCDAEDVCPDGDDTIDSDGDGIPDFCDCNVASADFDGNGLSHFGNDSSEVTLNLPSGSKNPSFSITEINQRTGGKPANRYIELVTVSYIDGNNATTTNTYSGSNESSASIDITGIVKSITVKLEDSYDGSTNGNMNITLSSVSYCGSGVVCTDSDGDGVCDEDDICPGGDDTIDTDGDGIPDDCDTTNGCETIITSNFPVNPLTQSGSGSNSTTLNFNSGTSDVSFSIFDIDRRTGGKKSVRYSERIRVSYVDANGNTQSSETIQNVSSANVDISGAVQSVTLTLDDSTGNGTNVSVTISEVTSCAVPAIEVGGIPEAITSTELSKIKLYPNPAKNEVFVTMNKEIPEFSITIYNAIGQKVQSNSYKNERRVRLDVSHLSDGNLYFVSFEVPGQSREIRKLLLLN